MRRADILSGVQEWLNSSITTNQMATGRLHKAKIVAYKFDAGKDDCGDWRLCLAVKTQSDDVEAAVVKWFVTSYGMLFASVFCEDELSGWAYGFPPKILHALTPAKGEAAQAWRADAIADAAERAAAKARTRTLNKIFKA